MSEVPALIVLAYVSLLVFGLIDNVRGPFYPEILSTLKLDGTQGSAFFAVTSFFGVVGSFYCGRLVRRFPSVNVLLFATLLLGLGFIAISRATNLLVLSLSCVGFGFAFGLLNVSQNLVVLENAPLALRRRIFSGLHAMYGMASLAAPLLATGLRERGFGWRDAFLILSAAPVLVALWGWRHRATRNHAPGMANPALAARDRTVAIGYSLLLGGYLWGELSVSTRLVLWLRAERGMDPASADYVLAGFFSALLCGRIAFSFLNFERFGNVLILMLSTGLAAVLYAVGLHHSPWWIVAAGLAMSPFYPVLMTQISHRFGEGSAAAMGWTMGIGNLSLVLMHVTIGALSDAFGLTRALYAAIAGLILVTIALLTLHSKERRAA